MLNARQCHATHQNAMNQNIKPDEHWKRSKRRTWFQCNVEIYFWISKQWMNGTRTQSIQCLSLHLLISRFFYFDVFDQCSVYRSQRFILFASVVLSSRFSIRWMSRKRKGATIHNNRVPSLPRDWTRAFAVCGVRCCVVCHCSLTAS